MKIEAALTYDKIRHDQDHNAHLVISLTAPTKDGEEGRAPICVVPVIDVSGSMAGEKLEYAKRSAIKLIEHLRPGDYTGLIAFESRVHVIIPPQQITPEVKEQMKAEIGKLHTIGGTNFAGGMLKAIELINNLDLPNGVLHRIIMLTDGQANEGPATQPQDIIRLFGANAGRVTASAFGYGNGSGISQEFLGDFAREAKGNYAYIRDPDGALTAFGKELGGLISTFATDLQLEINPLAGHEIESVISDVDADEEDVGGEITIKIPEILAEERRDLVLAVKLKSQKQAFPRAVNVFDVKVSFDTIATDGKKGTKTVEAKAKAQFVKPGEENPKPNPELDKIVALAEVIRAQIEAEEKAKQGDFGAAVAVMQNAANVAASRGHERLAAAASHTSASVGSHAAYADQQGYLRSFRYGGTRGMGVSEIDEGAAVFLAEAGVQLSNSSQSSTSASFAGDGTAVPNADLTGGIGGAAILNGHLVAPVAGAIIPNIGITQAIGDASQFSQWMQAQQQPPAPQTDTADKKREKALEKAAKKIKKSKSSARW
jgi:Mg-chelatase subunit ChlD